MIRVKVDALMNENSIGLLYNSHVKAFIEIYSLLFILDFIFFLKNAISKILILILNIYLY